MVTKEQLVKIMPHATKANIDKFYPDLLVSMKEYQINTLLRASAFLAQIAHESGSLHYVEEIASGEAYEGRKDLGNSLPGDGVKYKGRGLIQITGRSNYRNLSVSLKIADLLTEPELLELPKYACRSAAWFWKTHGCNELADEGLFGAITKKINGGYNGAAERLKLYANAKKVLGC